MAGGTSPNRAEVTRRYNANKRQKVREYYRDLKTDRPCVDCQRVYPHYVMQFDHVRGEKKCNIATMISSYKSTTMLDEEIAKCELVCANCHAERTWTRRQVD